MKITANYFFLCCFCLLLTLKGVSAAMAGNRFDLLVTMLNDESPQPASQQQLNAYIKRIVDGDRLASRSFQQYGDADHYFLTPDSEFNCLADGSCFGRHLALLEAMRRTEFAPDSADPGNAFAELDLLNFFGQDARLKKAIEKQIAQFIEKIVKVDKVRRTGDPLAKREIWILRNDHPAERQQEQTIQTLLRKYPKEFRFVYVEQKDYPELFSMIGKRWYSGMLYQGHLFKSFSTPDQWTEFFLGHLSGTTTRQFKQIPVLDAHVHILADGHQRWLEIYSDNQLSTAVNLALATDAHYAGLSEANESVLKFAQQHKGMMLPFVMLAPSDRDNLARFERYQQQGNRGLKLINGHGDVFTANPEQRLDTPELRSVFRYCEVHGIPVVWHVNSHLYQKGFIRVLEDFPKLRIVNPHFGGYLTDAPNVVRQLMINYPNLSFDLSLGMHAPYLVRSLEDISLRCAAWRTLLMQYPDRFLFGTDLVVDQAVSRSYARFLYSATRNFLEKKAYSLDYFSAPGYVSFDEQSHYQQNLNGLNLPESVLRKIYWENATRLYGAAE